MNSDLSSDTIPDDYKLKISSVVSNAVRELRALGYGWDALCNFAYKAANDGLYDVETEEIYDIMKH